MSSALRKHQRCFQFRSMQQPNIHKDPLKPPPLRRLAARSSTQRNSLPSTSTSNSTVSTPPLPPPSLRDSHESPDFAERFDFLCSALHHWPSTRSSRLTAADRSLCLHTSRTLESVCRSATWAQLQTLSLSLWNIHQSTSHGRLFFLQISICL